MEEKGSLESFVLAAKSEIKKLLRMPKYEWEYNIKCGF